MLRQINNQTIVVSDNTIEVLIHRIKVYLAYTQSKTLSPRPVVTGLY